MTEADDTIQIPGMPTLRNSVVPPISIQLPLTIDVRRRIQIAIGLFYLFMAIAMLLLALTIFAPGALSAPLLQRIVIICLQIFGAYWAAYFFIAAMRTLRDAFKRDGKLVITKTGFVDSRTGLKVEWSDIESARPIPGRANNWGVSLKLKNSAQLPRPPWLRGFGWLPRDPNEVHCQTLGLSRPSYEVQTAILHLVRQAGGSIQPPREAGWFRLGA